jgi:hypothetical protein
VSNMLPIVEILADATTNAERAQWLFACPYAVMHREHMTIRRILQGAGLIAGVSYLEAVLSLNNARRLEDGTLPQTIVLPVHITAQDLRAAARAGVEGAEC